MKWLVLFPNIKDGYSPYRPACTVADSAQTGNLFEHLLHELASFDRLPVQPVVFRST
jgi:hypothetical protein